MSVVSLLGRGMFLLWVSLFVVFALNSGCSSGGNDPGGAADAATGAVTDGVTSSLTSLGGGSPAGLNVKGQSSSSSSSSYSCSFNSEDGSQTCDCPGGGTVTYSWDDVHILEDSVELNHSFRQTFDACVVPACDGNRTIDGEITGRVEGRYDPSGDISVTATVSTAEQCAGLSVDDVHIGFEMSMSWDGMNQTVAGTICLDPPGDVIAFDSFEELMEAMGSGAACSAR